MADLVDITLLQPHRVLGKLQPKDAICSIHKGVADDLVKREIAQLTTAKHEPKEKPKKGAEGGE